MAERSKAGDSSSLPHMRAWVQTPLSAPRTIAHKKVEYIPQKSFFFSSWIIYVISCGFFCTPLGRRPVTSAILMGGDYRFWITHSPITLASLSSINLVSIFMCSSHRVTRLVTINFWLCHMTQKFRQSHFLIQTRSQRRSVTEGPSSSSIVLMEVRRVSQCRERTVTHDDVHDGMVFDSGPSVNEICCGQMLHVWEMWSLSHTKTMVFTSLSCQ